MIWTDERVETLRRLWAEGQSASQIAEQLQGGVTRNAVIGKLHRLGKPQRPKPAVQSRPSIFRARGAQPGGAGAAQAFHKAAFEAITAFAEEPGLATASTLGAHMCKWPIGDPEQNDFTFCGRASIGGRPYCPQHAGAAYRPTAPVGRDGLSADLSRVLARYA